ncbi:MAG: ribosome biogenesis GTP-binding protein YihA/YsxC [Aquabacterium sp.]
MSASPSRGDGNTNSPSPTEAARAWTHGARFLISASRIAELPPPGLPETAFVGRSNAGKSTAINTLAGRRQLAFASRTPGRTQLINLFELGPPRAPDAWWADLPGYGYAAVERAAKHRWQQVMADYLMQRPSLAGIVLMVDVRHGFTPLDRQLLTFVAPRVGAGEVRLLVLLTKADKLGRADRAKSLATARQVLADEVATDEADIGLTLFSAQDGSGVDDAALTLRQWAAGQPTPTSP